MTCLAHLDPGVPRPDRFASEPTINKLSQPDPGAGPTAGLEHHPPEDRAQLLGSIVEHLSDPLLVCAQDAQDPVIRISFVNQAFCDLLGYCHTDLVGRSPGMLVGPDTDLDTLRRVEAGLRSDEVVTSEVVLASASGHPTRVEATYRVLRAPDGVNWYVSQFRDVEARRHAATALRHSEVWAEALVEGSTDLVMVADETGVVRYASPALSEVLGYHPDDFVSRPFVDFLHPTDAGRNPGVFDRRPVSRGGRSHEFRVAHQDGSWRVVSLRVADRRTDPAVNGYVVNLRDVSARRRAEDLLAEQADLLEAIAKGAPLEITLEKIVGMLERRLDDARAAIGLLDDDGVIRVRAGLTSMPELVAQLDAMAPDQGPGLTLRSGVGELFVYDLADDDRMGTTAQVFADLDFVQARDSVLRSPRSGELLGSLSLFHRVARELGQPDLELVQRAMNLASIAVERHRFEAALEYQACYDPLTDLPNRLLLHQRIESALERLAFAGGALAVLFIDLDRFKVVNDAEGHATGDLVLQQVADRFRQAMVGEETLGRFGGDEYMVVSTEPADEAGATAVAARFARELHDPLLLPDGDEIFVTASIGISFTAEPTVLPESLIRDADVAMYRAKDQGRNQWVVFQPNLDQRAVERLANERALRSAIEGGQFELHYQPVVQLSDGSMTQVEALVRWNRPGHDQVMPNSFIPIAEESGLIVPIGWWVLSEAVNQAVRWPTLPGGREVEVAVNLSARQLADPELVEVVADVLDLTALDPARLCFEVTESALVHDVEHAVESLNRLKALGVRIAIDDFGTGYATLDYLRHFSMADYLKIDRAFVEGVDRPGSQEAAIVSAAIALAKSLGFTVVAEGVETLFQMEALRALDCELAQGYLFSRPLPVTDAVELLASREG
jgi:diguanylate cyclase (GGDEF)-like protein/PAS domain S-box-containing protein